MCKIEQEGLSQCLAIEPTTCPQYYMPRARGSQCLEEHHKMGVSLGGMMGRARLGLRQCQKMGFSPWRWHWSAGGWGPRQYRRCKRFRGRMRMEPSRSLVGGSPGVIVQGSRGVRLEHQDRIGSQRVLKAHTHVPSAPGLD